VGVTRDIVNCAGSPVLLFTVETLSGDAREQVKSRPQVDYREQLSEDEYSLFNLLRDERKRLSDEDSIPVFGIFNNAQLAEMVTRKMSTLTEVAGIKGVGKVRSEKYGQAMLDIIQQQL
jgi:superfamily II DNA helicase RecQ